MAKFIYSGEARNILDRLITAAYARGDVEAAPQLESVKALFQDLFDANGRMCRRLNKLEPQGQNEDART